jgi:predicted esterase
VEVFMHRVTSWAVMVCVAFLAWGARPGSAAEPESKAPHPKDGGTLYAWKAADGLAYIWRGPKDYDAEKGVNLTLILHGSNLSRQWGFANHNFKTFRPDDLVVSPDGTTSNGNGGFNFLKEPKDGNRLHALIEELKKAFKVRATYLYGHSQGSFFALQYAGQHPDDVTGIVAHASGLWTWTNVGKHGHGKPIVFMHGTLDPVVPYGQSVGGYQALKDAGYPLLRLRSLEFWNHWPAEHNGSVAHTSQQLAWVEGMSTTDPARLQACLERLAPGSSKEEKGEHDWAGQYALAKRIALLEGAPASLKGDAEAAVTKIQELAEKHVKALAVAPGAAFEDKPWVAHLPIFLRAFQGVPACDALAETWKETRATHEKEAIAHLRKHYAALKKSDFAVAYEEGVAAIQHGFLWHECWDADFRKNLQAWHKDAKKLKLSKKALKDYDAVMPAFDKQIAAGWKEFADLNGG